jgi:hypothetical protein
MCLGDDEIGGHEFASLTYEPLSRSDRCVMI